VGSSVGARGAPQSGKSRSRTKQSPSVEGRFAVPPAGQFRGVPPRRQGARVAVPGPQGERRKSALTEVSAHLVPPQRQRSRTVRSEVVSQATRSRLFVWRRLFYAHSSRGRDNVWAVVDGADGRSERSRRVAERDSSAGSAPPLVLSDEELWLTSRARRPHRTSARRAQALVALHSDSPVRWCGTLEETVVMLRFAETTRNRILDHLCFQPAAVDMASAAPPARWRSVATVGVETTEGHHRNATVGPALPPDTGGDERPAAAEPQEGGVPGYAPALGRTGDQTVVAGANALSTPA
jgi:hypothetical protein